MADGELLRAYFEARLGPGELDHELPASAATAGMNYSDSMPGAGYSLVPSGWRREGEFFVNPEIVARIAYLRKELRRQCAAGESILWGRPILPGRIGPPRLIDIPLSGWRQVQFLPKISGLGYLGLVWDAVEVRKPIPKLAVITSADTLRVNETVKVSQTPVASKSPRKIISDHVRERKQQGHVPNQDEAVSQVLNAHPKYGRKQARDLYRRITGRGVTDRGRPKKRAGIGDLGPKAE
jgi:hypothetical protein